MIDSVWPVQYMRQVAILDRLRAEGALTVDQLSAATSASRATIRRDLDTLESAGVINRVHGGAVLRADSGADGDLTRPFAQVVTADSEDKTAIARLAAGLVNDGDVVLLDIGTTTMRLAVELRGRTITVITANLAVLDVFRDDVNVELILLGGQVRRQYHSLVGALTQEALRHVRPGSIVLMHANGRGYNTAAAVPTIVQKLKAQGYELVTVSELLAAGEPEIVQTCYDARPGDTDKYDRLFASSRSDARRGQP